MNVPALILAGGLGTRLRHLIPDLPKPMANVAGSPFLYYILKHLQIQGIKDIYISVGYKSEKIQEYFGNYFHSSFLHYIKEEEPLGTGGAISYAIQQINADNILIINGDTFLNFDLNQFIQAHQNENLTLLLKYVQQSNRYGFVDFENQYVQGFSEKSEEIRNGWINAGVYLMNKKFFLSTAPQQKVFSFEKDYLEKIYTRYPIKVFTINKYFIDIGVPEDYERAQKDFSELKYLDINSEWTLFLDRDGVINQKLDKDYVKTIEEFHFMENVIPALKVLRKKFGRIIVVTNQQGIGKKIMTERDLDTIHQYLLSELKKENIEIDKIYFAPQLEQENSIMRKPHIGMALKAKEDFPEIQFHQSIMVGDSLSDIQFAHNAGMYSVYLSSAPEKYFNYDFTFRSLFDFSKCFAE
ncbi:MAG: HAD-IIIA family hydrolase [Bacteroidia bacterium]|nr:HAD-IIIA family hydrolase [Bacteroidia bacterium]